MPFEFLLVLVFNVLAFVEAYSTANGVSCNPNDLKALTDFKSGISYDSSDRLTTWTGQTCCQWEGISCDNTTGRVTEIYLPGLYTRDDMPFEAEMAGLLSDSLTLLSALQVLSLEAQRGLYGKIPTSIGQRLPNLRRLFINGNNLTGPVPESIGLLSKLEKMSLDTNRLSGSLPSSLGRLENLSMLYLDTNRFTGVIPESIGNLTNLVELDLYGNSLSGNIPESIGDLKRMKNLDLSSNLFSGPIPSSLCNLASIEVMDLGHNNLEGEIPFPCRPGQLPKLWALGLENNLLTGKIPSLFGNLVSLQRVSLANNRLEGEIPSSLGNLLSLSQLILSGNRLSGQIPESLGQLQNLSDLYLSYNLLESPLPQTFPSVGLLDLSFNLLNLSSIPKVLYEMPFLSKLHLAGCGIEGQIPEELLNIRSQILELDLSHNNLIGSIPTWIANFSHLYSLNLSCNSLEYEIPDSIRNMQLGELDLHSNNLTGSVSRVFDVATLIYVDLSDNSFSSGIERMESSVIQSLDTLNFSNNLFQGRLPSSIGSFQTLKSLDLSSNKLGYGLLNAMANISSLETLRLQRNKFSGEIPEGFLELKILTDLDLSYNLLVGQIPEGKPLSDFPPSSFKGNKGLCGKPLKPCR